MSYKHVELSQNVTYVTISLRREAFHVSQMCYTVTLHHICYEYVTTPQNDTEILRERYETVRSIPIHYNVTKLHYYNILQMCYSPMDVNKLSTPSVFYYYSVKLFENCDK